MKKILLATTAIAGLLAFGANEAKAEVDLSLGGYFQGYLGYVDQDVDGYKDFDWLRDAQIQFHGETALDNGLIIGAHMEMQTEADESDGVASFGNNDNRFKESYLFFSSEYGRLNMGAENGAGYLLQVAAPAADANIDGFDPNFLFVQNQSAARTAYKNIIGRDEDADKLTYITPKMAGLQFAGTFAPTDEQRGLGSALEGTSSDDSNTALAEGELQDLWELALRYDAAYEGFDFHFGGGYAQGNAKETGLEDTESYNVGVAMEYGGFGFGYNYTATKDRAVSFDPAVAAVNVDDDMHFVGLDYTTGAYKFGASYLYSEASGGGLEDKIDRYSIGAQYAFGPGMTFNGSVNIYEINSHINDTEFQDNDGVSVLLGTDIAF